MNIVKVIKSRVELFLNGYSRGVSIGWIGKSNNSIYRDVETYLKEEFPTENFESLIQEAIQIWQLESSTEENIVAAKHWNAEANLCVLLYVLISTQNIRTIVETGVVNGVSTRVMMKALEGTGGTLHSFDILESSRNVYQGQGNWIFHKLNPDYGIKKQLISQVERIERLDLWLHDSNHGQSWQEFEYNLAWKKLTTGGFLLSDDVDASPAWGIAAIQYLDNPSTIFDTRKFIGISSKKV